MILPYQAIKRLCIDRGLITPWNERDSVFGMTYGLGPAGYDVRIKDRVEIEPSGFALASTVEHFKMTDDTIGQVCDKSTWARRGLCVQNTIIEPGWRGYLTLELTNHSKNTIVVSAGAPICQIIFMQLTSRTSLPYGGKYQDQPNRPVAAIDEW